MTHTRGELFDPLFAPAASPLAEEISDHAWVVALLQVEAALTRAAATVGLVSAEHAATVTSVAAALGAPDGIDIADLGRRSAAGRQSRDPTGPPPPGGLCRRGFRPRPCTWAPPARTSWTRR